MMDNVDRMVPRYRAQRPSRPITLKQIMQRLDVTLMTLYSWREGSPVRKPLPYKVEHEGKRERIIIEERDLVEFLREYRYDLLEKWQSTRQQ